MTTFSNTNINMRVTDAHVHFWDISKMNYPWLNEVMAIKKTFGVADYEAATAGIPIHRMIFIQCECLPEEYQTEVDYVIEIARQASAIQGIVAYFPLEKVNAEQKLEKLASNRLVKGIRRLEEHPDSLYTNSSFIANMDLLRQYDLSFDLCVKAHQLPEAVRLVQAAPSNRYMLDHFGKPAISAGELDQWKHHIIELSENPNVYCKLSGLVTEADWNKWTVNDLQPYVDIVFEYFGPNRIAFGGDWPVVKLASSYDRWFDTAIQLCGALSAADLDRVFYQNALDFYKIDSNA